MRASLNTSSNWKDIQQADIEATGQSPGDDAEAAIFATLAPGTYTAIVVDANNATGVALVEAFKVQ